MTPTQEIHYLGQMLTATTDKDRGRLQAIIEKLEEK